LGMGIVVLSFAVAAAADSCLDALNKSCGTIRSSCKTYRCEACEVCVITNQAALSSAGCTSSEETGYCNHPPPLKCKHTDSRGDTYDLSGIPKVDGKWTKIGGKPVWYHAGVCGLPTQSETDPEVGCLPTCDTSTDPDCQNGKYMDMAGAAVCQFDPAIHEGKVEYNMGMLDSQNQKWSDGSEPGKGVVLSYTGGSMRGGCRQPRSTELLIHCDACNAANISVVDEPTSCHYRINITSIAGCPTNKLALYSGDCQHLCDPSALQCKKVPPGTPGANATLHDCAKTCVATPTPAPTPAPPLYSAPWIRVLNSIPSPHAVDVEIVQGSSNRSYTWKGYGFGDYSSWTSKFEAGKGTINIIDSKSGKTLLSIPDAPLTPGPLVVAVKCPASAAQGACWPPSDPQLGGSVETIAASFSPPTQGSGVRLFNLSPDTQSASLVEGGKAVVSRIQYGDASEWVPVPSFTPLNSTIMDDTSGKAIATDTTSPPAAPSVFTLWLLGNQTTVGGDGAYSVRTLSLEDAPHDELTTPTPDTTPTPSWQPAPVAYETMTNMSVPWRQCVQELESRDFETVNISTPDGTVLEIEAATYSGKDLHRDVTEVVRGLVEGNRLYVTGGIQTKLGDPEFGVPKVFRVKYFARGISSPQVKNIKECPWGGPKIRYSECAAAAQADCDTDNACVAVAVAVCSGSVCETSPALYVKFSSATFCVDAPRFVLSFDLYMKSGSVYTPTSAATGSSSASPTNGSSTTGPSDTSGSSATSVMVVHLSHDHGSWKWVALALVAVLLLLAGISLGWCIKGRMDKRCSMTTAVKDEAKDTDCEYTIFEGIPIEKAK